MPYKDRQKQRAAQRAWKQQHRETVANPGRTLGALLPLPVRLATVADALGVLEGQVAAVLADPKLGSVDRARCVAYLLGVALRCVEMGDLARRIEEIETALGGGDDAKNGPRAVARG